MKPYVIAISGQKNVGKTTTIVNLIPLLKEQGLKVATIKHDGHDFEADVAGTDSYKHHAAGAYGTAVFSNKRVLIHKEVQTNENELIALFPEADLIILEGFKSSNYPKLEVIRKAISEESVTNHEGLLGYISDVALSTKLPIYALNDYPSIARELRKIVEESKDDE